MDVGEAASRGVQLREIHGLSGFGAVSIMPLPVRMHPLIANYLISSNGRIPVGWIEMDSMAQAVMTRDAILGRNRAIGVRTSAVAQRIFGVPIVMVVA
jgi:hypothetical protein